MITAATESQMSATAAALRCLGCGSDAGVDLGPAPPIAIGRRASDVEQQLAAESRDVRIYSCQNCRLVYRSPSLSEDQLAELYRSLPPARWNMAADRFEIAGLAKQWLLHQYDAGTKLSVLDVGAYEGKFLRTLPSRWSKFAIEPSSDACRVHAEHDIETVGEFLVTPDDSLRDRFDVVTIFDVFEHFLRPTESLRDAVAMLKPGGKLLVSTGNADHWTSQRLNGRHWYWHTIQHVCMGSESYFRHVADELGCRIALLSRHAHMSGTARTRCRETLETWHAWSRTADGARKKVAGLIQRLPGLGNLRHRTFAPNASTLNDHLFIVMEREV